MSEATATWQWNNFLEGQAALGQVVVHINLDETCVKLCPCVPRGAVAIDGGSAKKGSVGTGATGALRLADAAAAPSSTDSAV